MSRLDPVLVERLYQRAKADRWQVSIQAFASSLEESARHTLADQQGGPPRIARYLESLHLEDLALACACAEGLDLAWDHFIALYRPILYRAADALDASGGAREIADSLYAELFGLRSRGAERQSQFRYFHGRSSLATWLRAVLSQRYVDRRRLDARTEPLPEEDTANALVASATPTTSRAQRYLELLRRVMSVVVAALPARERLRLRCYYAQNLTLAQIGTMLGEHEATVSRNLARTRRTVRHQVEQALRRDEQLTDSEIADCFAAALQDPGPLDLAELLGPPEEDRKELSQDRSK